MCKAINPVDILNNHAKSIEAGQLLVLFQLPVLYLLKKRVGLPKITVGTIAAIVMVGLLWRVERVGRSEGGNVEHCNKEDICDYFWIWTFYFPFNALVNGGAAQLVISLSELSNTR